jgi:hypothetical protein
LVISGFALIAGSLNIFVPLLIGIGCFAVWYRVLPRPGHFLVISVLAMFGLSQFFHWILRIVLTLGGFGRPSFVYGGGEELHDIFWVEMWQALAVAPLTAFIGFFLLRTAMRLQVRA